MRFVFPLVCFANLFLTALPALSAENPIRLLEVSGKVLVNSETGMIPAEAGQIIADGSNVFVADDAIARLATANSNCETLLPAGKVSTVISATLCADVKITPTATNTPTGGLPPPVVGLTFFAAMVGTVAVAELTKDKPVSAP